MGDINPAKMPKGKKIVRKDDPNEVSLYAEGGKVKSPAWTRKEGKSPTGGLNAKGRASAKAQGMNLKPPQPEGGSRRDSFCARMSGMPGPMKDEKGRPTRKALALKKWKC